MYPRRLLIALGLAAFLGSLVAFAPLHFLLKLLPSSVSTQVVEVGGRLTEGSARLRGREGEATLRWTLQPAWLVTLGLVGNWQLDGNGLRGTGDFSLRPWRYKLHVQAGELSAQRLARLAGSAGLTLEQPLGLHDVAIAGMPGARVSAVTGQLAWGPGVVRVANRQAPVDVPALRGRLDTREGIVSLVIDGEAEPGAALANATWDPESKQIHAAVLARGADLLGISTQSGQAPDKPFVELRQTLQ